jgi:hypothetical protein
MTNDRDDSVTVRIIPLSGSVGSTKSLRFTVRIEASDDPTIRDTSQQFEIIVVPNT